MILEGLGLTEIAKVLNGEGISAPKGKKWGKATLYGILTNEAYCGTLVWGRRGKSHQVIRVENAWPPIVDTRTF